MSALPFRRRILEGNDQLLHLGFLPLDGDHPRVRFLCQGTSFPGDYAGGQARALQMMELVLNPARFVHAVRTNLTAEQMASNNQRTIRAAADYGPGYKQIASRNPASKVTQAIAEPYVRSTDSSRTLQNLHMLGRELFAGNQPHIEDTIAYAFSTGKDKNAFVQGKRDDLSDEWAVMAGGHAFAFYEEKCWTEGAITVAWSAKYQAAAAAAAFQLILRDPALSLLVVQSPTGEIDRIYTYRHSLAGDFTVSLMVMELNHVTGLHDLRHDDDIIINMINNQVAISTIACGQPSEYAASCVARARYDQGLKPIGPQQPGLVHISSEWRAEIAQAALARKAARKAEEAKRKRKAVRADPVKGDELRRKQREVDAATRADPVKGDELRRKKREGNAATRADPVKGNELRTKEREGMVARRADPVKNEELKRKRRKADAAKRADPVKGEELRRKKREGNAKRAAKKAKVE